MKIKICGKCGHVIMEIMDAVPNRFVVYDLCFLCSMDDSEKQKFIRHVHTEATNYRRNKIRELMDSSDRPTEFELSMINNWGEMFKDHM